MNFCTTSVERMGELYLGARYGSAGVDGSTGGRSVGVYEESDWGRSSPSMHLRLAILLPTAASVLSPFLSAGPGELQQAHHHCLSLYLSHEWQPHSSRPVNPNRTCAWLMKDNFLTAQHASETPVYWRNEGNELWRVGTFERCRLTWHLQQREKGSQDRDCTYGLACGCWSRHTTAESTCWKTLQTERAPRNVITYYLDSPSKY